MQIKFFPFLNDLLAHLGVHQSPQWHGWTDRWSGVYIIYIYIICFRLVGMVMERDGGEDMRGEIIIKCSAVKNSFVLRTFFLSYLFCPFLATVFACFGPPVSAGRLVPALKKQCHRTRGARVLSAAWRLILL